MTYFIDSNVFVYAKINDKKMVSVVKRHNKGNL